MNIIYMATYFASVLSLSYLYSKYTGDSPWFVFLSITTIFVIFIFKNSTKNVAPDTLRRHDFESNFGSYGPINSMLKCPHCEARGHVRTSNIRIKKGISGAKAIAALMTSGASLIATGISLKEKKTEAFCEKCNSTWKY